MPIRIQRKRSKGWKMPENTIYVGRPGKRGNPWSIDYCLFYMPEGTTRTEAAAEAVSQFRLQVPHMVAQMPDYLTALRGKDLACWCKPGEPCHADVLLELANA